VQLLLNLLIVEEERDAILVRTAAGLVLHLVVELFIECAVPVPSAGLAVEPCLRCVADTNAVIGVDATRCLSEENATSSASLLPIMQEGLVSSEASYLQLEMRP
jgi:hypothetical protein